MKKIILSLCAVFVMATSLSALNHTDKNDSAPETNHAESVATYQIQGIISDMNSGETIPGASVIIDGKKYYSDFSGKFNIPKLNKGKHIIEVNYISYRSENIEVNVDNNEELKIQLSQQ